MEKIKLLALKLDKNVIYYSAALSSLMSFISFTYYNHCHSLSVNNFLGRIAQGKSAVIANCVLHPEVTMMAQSS